MFNLTIIRHRTRNYDRFQTMKILGPKLRLQLALLWVMTCLIHQKKYKSPWPHAMGFRSCTCHQKHLKLSSLWIQVSKQTLLKYCACWKGSFSFPCHGPFSSMFCWFLLPTLFLSSCPSGGSDPAGWGRNNWDAGSEDRTRHITFSSLLPLLRWKHPFVGLWTFIAVWRVLLLLFLLLFALGLPSL